MLGIVESRICKAKKGRAYIMVKQSGERRYWDRQFDIIYKVDGKIKQCDIYARHEKQARKIFISRMQNINVSKFKILFCTDTGRKQGNLFASAQYSNF